MNIKLSWWHILLISIGLIGIGIGIGCFVNQSVVIDSQNIVLTFVGILATFVVVSNYAQVKNAEEKFANKLEMQREEYNARFIFSTGLMLLSEYERTNKIEDFYNAIKSFVATAVIFNELNDFEEVTNIIGIFKSISLHNIAIDKNKKNQWLSTLTNDKIKKTKVIENLITEINKFN